MLNFKQYILEAKDTRSDHLMYRDMSILTKSKQLQIELTQNLKDGIAIDLREQLTKILSTANLKGRRIVFEDNMGVRVSIFRRDGQSEYTVYSDGVDSPDRIPTYKINQMPWMQSIKALLCEYKLLMRYQISNTGIELELNV